MLVDDDSTALVTAMPEPGPAASASAAAAPGVPLVRGLTVSGVSIAFVSAGGLLPLVYLAGLSWSAILGLFGGLGGLAGLIVSFVNVVRGESALRNLLRHMIDLTMATLLFGIVVLAANLIAPFGAGSRVLSLVAFYLAGMLFTGLTTQPLVRLMLGGR